MRLKNIYGAKYDAQFADEKTLSLAKREWCRNISRFDKDKLCIKFEHVKKAMNIDPRYEWPNIGLILEAPTGASPNGMNSAAYLPYARPKKIERRITPAEVEQAAERGRQTITDLKAMLAMQA